MSVGLSVSQDDIVRLWAKQEIRDALSRYCRGLDRRDKAMTLAVFHEDASVDYRGMYQGTPAGLIDYVWEQHGALERHSHQMTNVLIEVDIDAGRAISEAYLVGGFWTHPDEDGQQLEFASRNRYLDRWEFRNPRWPITDRVHLLDRLVDHPFNPPAIEVHGARDTSDPSYALFER